MGRSIFCATSLWNSEADAQQMLNSRTRLDALKMMPEGNVSTCIHPFLYTHKRNIFLIHRRHVVNIYIYIHMHSYD